MSHANGFCYLINYGFSDFDEFLCMRYVIRGLDGIAWYWIVLELMFGWILRLIIGTVLDQQIKRIGVQYFWLMACWEITFLDRYMS